MILYIFSNVCVFFSDSQKRMYKLNGSTYLAIQDFQGFPSVSIRKYRKIKEKLYPSKIGVTLISPQLRKMLEVAEDVTNDINTRSRRDYNLSFALKLCVSDGVACFENGFGNQVSLNKTGWLRLAKKLPIIEDELSRVFNGKTIITINVY